MGRILVVEDYDVLRRTWQGLLAESGHQVDVAATGEEALQRIYRAFPAYDVVVLDLILPLLSGRDLIQRAAGQLRNRTPVVVVTGRGWAVESLGSVRQDVFEVLDKPVDIVRFLDVVERGVALAARWRERTQGEDLRLELQSRIAELVEQVVHLHSESLTDPLTNLPNRRALVADLGDVLETPGTRTAPLALLLVDADRFSRFNGRFGYDGGDLAIRHLADRLGRRIREGDKLYRYGGDEFVVLADCPHPEEARQVAERIRLEVEVAGAVPGLGEPITVSVGVSFAEPGQVLDFGATFGAANAALRRAKASGGNGVFPLP